MTLVGEPQNLLIAKHAGWTFGEFFLRMAPVSMPVLVAGLVTCAAREDCAGSATARACRPTCAEVIDDYDAEQARKRTPREAGRG